MLIILSYSGHYPNKLVEVTEEELAHIYEVQGEKYLCDTKEGIALITSLGQREIKVAEIIAYI